MSEKYFSQLEGYTDCFIEVSDKWTMKEVRKMTDADGEEYFEMFNGKVDAMLLRDVEGKEFTNPKTFKPEDLDEFDISMVGFVGSILSTHVAKRKRLGGLSVKTLQAGSNSTN